VSRTSFASSHRKGSILAISLPPVCPREDLHQRISGSTVVWATRSVAVRAAKHLPWPIVDADAPLAPDVAWLIAVGGGELMDRAKSLRTTRPGLKLVLIPSIWGSGAEASPIIVLSREREKQIVVLPSALPDLIVYWPELAVTASAHRQRAACGDCWSHALEGFLSPLAKPALQADLAEVIRRLLDLPLSYETNWFPLSSLACAGQSQAGVGLVHGIAHALEAPLRRAQPERCWHHALLCSTFLFPVMQFNRATAAKWSQLLATHRLEEDQVLQKAREVCDTDLYHACLCWPRIGRLFCATPAHARIAHWFGRTGLNGSRFFPSHEPAT
jgi:hypothetical protein